MSARTLSMFLVAVMVCLLSGVLQASVITWNAGGGGTNTWVTPANWDLGLPGAADTAQFTGPTARTVTIDASNPSIDTINVSGPAPWTFSTGGTLNVGTAFNYGNTSAGSTFNAVLAGPSMALNVSGGNLLLTNNANSFGGGIKITGGKLTAALQGVGGTMRTLGSPSQTITIGDSSGSADASLELYGYGTTETFAQPIVIASGSTGRACIIGSKYNSGDGVDGIDLSGGITLHKDLTLVNNNQRGGGYCDRRVMEVSGDITGTGNIVKEGEGLVEFTTTLKTIQITNGGAGYTSAPSVSFAGGGGNNYGATATVVGGVVTAITITDPGWGLTAAPTVSFSGGGGSGAAATATITSANDSYTGTTTVKDGWLEIIGGTQTFTGDVHVDGGMVMVLGGDARLGAAANNLTMGSVGRYGVLTLMQGGDLTTSRTITLNGSGAILGSYGNTFNFNGSIGGSGQLICDHIGGASLNVANSYSGGTRVIWGAVYARNNVAALGTGNVVLDNSGVLAISGVNSVDASASVLVKSFSTDNSQLFGTVATFAIPANIGSVPTIDPNSSGKLGLFGGNTGSAVNTLLSHQIGNGYMFIGSSRNSTGGDDSTTLTGTSLAIGAGNTYRFAPTSGGITLDAAATTTGVLVDPDAGTPANVLCGAVIDQYSAAASSGWLTSNDAQTFKGTLYVNRSYYQAAVLSSGSALGDAGGAIKLAEGYVKLYGSGPNINKGALSVESHSMLEFDHRGGTGNSLTVASLSRANNGCLTIFLDSATDTSFLGTKNKLIVTAPPVESGGMVSPSILVAPSSTWPAPEFADYDTVGAPSVGFIPAVYKVNAAAGTVNSQALFDTTIPTDIVKVAGTDVTLSGAKTLQALKTDSQILGSQNLTLTSGGLILTGAGKTHAVNLSTGGEMVVTVGGNASGNATRNTVNGAITATGLTKTGMGTLVLGAANPALTGDVTVNQGSLEISNDSQLGLATNKVILNNQDGNWHDGFRIMGALTLPSTRTIVLGNNGTNLYTESGVTIAGKITGSGFLNTWSAGSFTFTNPLNDYTGGTVLNSPTYLSGGGQLGTGPVTLQSPVMVNDNTYRANRFILSTGTNGPRLELSTATPSFGSIEGGGQFGGQSGQFGIFLDATNMVLTLGGNNASTDYYGPIIQYDDGWGNVANAGLTKVGTGTFGMYGMNTYTGATTVNNGRLNNNNIVRGAVNVTSITLPDTTVTSPNYGGTGTTLGLVTVGANGRADGSGVFNAGLNLTGGAVATGNITINGPLSVDNASSFSSNGPIAGAVVTAGAFAGNAGITGNVSVNGGTFGGNHTISGTFASSGAVSGANVFNGAVTVFNGTFTGTHVINANYTQGGGVFSGSSTFGTAGSPVAVAINAGTFSGNNTVNGTFTTATASHAVITPHNSGAGTLTIFGDVTLDHSTVFNFNLASPGTTGSGINDFIDITGNLSLDGTLNVNNLSGFGAGTYRLFNYTGTLTGASTLLQGTMPADFTYTIDTSTTGQINLGVTTPYIPGDTDHSGGSTLNTLDIDAIYQHFGAAYTSQWKVYPDTNPVSQEDVTYEVTHYMFTNYADANLDRYTDFTDFQVLLDHWQAPGGWGDGDFNGDGTVDFLDFQVLLDYWNPTGWSAGPSQVPEPASLSLLLLGGLAMLRRKK